MTSYIDTTVAFSISKSTVQNHIKTIVCLYSFTGKNNQTASRMQLPMGDHRFAFQFPLPDCHMPPPFEGTVGYVRYFIKATIDRPWKFDHQINRFFSILAAKDLNLIPEALVRIKLLVWNVNRNAVVSSLKHFYIRLGFFKVYKQSNDIWFQ